MICVNSITITQNNQTLRVGNSCYLNATVSPANATCNCVAWSSSNQYVASVNESSGLVTAQHEGTVTITAAATDGSGCFATITVTVTSAIKVADIELNATQLSLREGNTYALTAYVQPANADDKTIIWTSSAPNIATVSNSGVVTAISAGNATICATAHDGGSACAVCSVTVTENILVNSINVFPESKELHLGQSAFINAYVNPSNADNPTVVWQSSNPSVVAVNESSGQITAIALGTATITVMSTDGSNKCACCAVIVLPVLVTDIEIESTHTIQKHEYFTLQANVIPNYASNKNLLWCSSDASIVTVDEDTGRIHGESVGTAFIYVTALGGNCITRSCFVKVIPQVRVESLEISAPQHAIYTDDSNTLQLTATVSPNNALDKRVSWSCFDEASENVFSVDSNGLVTGLNEGIGIVKATSLDNPNVFNGYLIKVRKTDGYGSVQYNGNTYTIIFPIDVFDNNILDGWTLETTVEGEDLKIDFNIFRFFAGYIPDDFNGYATGSNDANLNFSQRRNLRIASLILAIPEGLASGFDSVQINYKFMFYVKNNLRRVVIQIGSSKVRSIYHEYANNREYSFVQAYGIYNNEYVQRSIAIRNLYRKLTGDNNATGNYDLVLTADARHYNDIYSSYLWINSEGKFMEKAFFYDNDRAVIGERSGLFESDFTPLFNLPLNNSCEAADYYQELLAKL